MQGNRAVQKGDYLQIHAPGGQTFYVQVSDVSDPAAERLCRIQGASVDRPQESTVVIQHFFDARSSRTFELTMAHDSSAQYQLNFNTKEARIEYIEHRHQLPAAYSTEKMARRSSSWRRRSLSRQIADYVLPH